MAYNLRLPPALDTDARARCERLGISLNALICVALDAYLSASTALVDTPTSTPSGPISPGYAGPEPDGAARPAPNPAPPAKLSKQQRRELTRLQRLERKA